MVGVYAVLRAVGGRGALLVVCVAVGVLVVFAAQRKRHGSGTVGKTANSAVAAPLTFVDVVAIRIQRVGIHGACGQQVHVFENGGARVHVEVAPIQRIAENVVAAAKVEALKYFDFARALARSVLPVAHLHFQVVDQAEGDQTTLATAGRTVYAIAVGRVGLHSAIGIYLHRVVVVEARLCKVGLQAKVYRWRCHVANYWNELFNGANARLVVAVQLGAQRGAYPIFARGPKALHGVARHQRILGIPRARFALEVPLLSVVGRWIQRKPLKHFHAGAHRNVVAEPVAHLLQCALLKQCGFLGFHRISAVTGVAHAQLRVPLSAARLAQHIAKEKALAGQCHFRQGNGNGAVAGVLRVAAVQR